MLLFLKRTLELYLKPSLIIEAERDFRT